MELKLRTVGGMVAAGDLAGLDEGHVREGRPVGAQILGGIVVGDGQDPDPGIPGHGDQLHGGQIAVGQAGVGVQIDVGSFHNRFSFRISSLYHTMFFLIRKRGYFIKK